jgi:hypothetical protein
MKQPVHILDNLGVLVSFSIVKNVTESEIKQFLSHHKKSRKTEAQLEELLRHKVATEMSDSLSKGQVPGVLSLPASAHANGIDPRVARNIPAIMKIISVLVEKFIERQYDRMTMCFFINTLVNSLGLSENDFMKFHNAKDVGDEDDEDDEGEDDEGTSENSDVKE